MNPCHIFFPPYLTIGNPSLFLFLPNWSLQPTIKALQHGTFLFVLDKHSPSSSPPFPSWALSADLYEPHMRFLNEKYRIKKRQ